ncbi:MAG: zinc-dependent metalloprotease [Phycisphaerae bacterium]
MSLDLFLRNRTRLAGGLAACLLVGLVFAEEPIQNVPPGGPPPAAGKPDGDGKPDKPDKPKRFPDFNEVIKDMKPTEGLFTLYRYDPDDKERDSEKLLCRIPRSLLNEDLLFATSISSGGPLTGYMWSSWLVRWEIIGNQLKLVTPDTRFAQPEDKPVSDVVRRTYNDGFIAAVPIVTMNPGGDPVIDLGALLKSNVADVDFIAGGGQVRPELSKWAKVKNFPNNMLIEVDLAVSSRGSGGEVGVSYAFQRLPKLGGYKPRLADPRVGYFMTTRRDWSKSPESRETVDRYINRWQLEKKDPSLEFSPPKKPITFIIEKTVPIQWRRWVREGIAEWNAAFEKIGFVDAIIVQQQTDDNEFKDYDPEDARYNFFRWIVTGQGFAMGPSLPDPRTGQLIDADIIMDDSFVRAYMGSFDIFAGGKNGYVASQGPGFQLLMKQYPEMVPNIFKYAEPQTELSRFDLDRELMNEANDRMTRQGRHVCMYADGMSEEMAMMNFAMLATASGKKFPERLIGMAIKEVVTHEVGHTLGLRHNFKASSWLGMDEIKRRRNETDEPTVASVMDYNPLLFFADDDIEKVRHVMTPGIGPYDMWAIEYGYRAPGKGDKGEDEMLSEIASRGTQAGLAFATDEDTMGAYSPDPSVNRFDFSDSPLSWAKSRVDLTDKLLGNVCDWAIKSGESREYITRAFNILMGQRARNFSYVGRLIGGQYYNRDHKGDPDARPTFVIVDADTQRGALKMLLDTLFNDEFFKTDADVLNNLAVSRWWDWDTTPPMRLDYPVHDRIAMMQLSVLFEICSPPVMQRIYDAEMKATGANRYTAAEHITGLRDGIWASLSNAGDGNYTDAKPMISSISRNLQKEYLNLMLSAAQMPPGAGMSADLNGMIRFAMRELSERIGKALEGKGKLDFATRAHLNECKSRIDRVLDAKFTAR